MLRFLLSLFLCDHADTYREKQQGVYRFVCRRCGKSAPVMERTAKEVKQIKQIKPAHERMKAQKATGPAQVVPIRRMP